MSVLFMESFDHWASAQLPGKFSGMVNSGSYITVETGGGRFSTNGMGINGNWAFVWKTVPSATTYYIGFAYKYPSELVTAHSICTFESGTQCQVTLGMRADVHFLTLQTGDRDIRSGTVLWTSSSALTPDVWNYIEIKVTIGDSANYIVKVNGVEWVNTTGDTKPASATDITQITFGNTTNVGSSGNRRYYDDIWIADDQLYGDSRIQCIVPTEPGNYAQWTPSAGNNWDCVEEKPPVTTDFVSSGTAGQIDTYVVENVTPTTGTVVAVAGNFYAQKSDAGARSIAIATRLGGTDDAGSGIALPSSWGYLQDIKATKPGGGAWAIADVNNAEFGVKMIA